MIFINPGYTESHTKGAWEPHAALRKVVENHRYKRYVIFWQCSIWSDYGVVFETLIVAANLVVAKSMC